MSELLFVNACVRGARSRTLALARHFLTEYEKSHPGDRVTELNLMEERLEPQYPEVLAERDTLWNAGRLEEPMFAPAREMSQADLVVVETRDAVLVAPREQAQDVKKIVNRLQRAGRPECRQHPQVYRPWGSYETLVLDGRFQVKRIIVTPGGELSLQMHHHRAEHWVVVSGTAEVTNGDVTRLYTENQSTYIPVGTRHRLKNPGVIPLVLIEIQSGSYLGEDDIVRFADVYGRGDRA